MSFTWVPWRFPSDPHLTSKCWWPIEGKTPGNPQESAKKPTLNCKAGCLWPGSVPYWCYVNSNLGTTNEEEREQEEVVGVVESQLLATRMWMCQCMWCMNKDWWQSAHWNITPVFCPDKHKASYSRRRNFNQHYSFCLMFMYFICSVSRWNGLWNLWQLMLNYPQRG